PALQGLFQDHPAAVDARHHRRHAAGVHSGGGRVRHSRSAGRSRYADDRQGDLGGVFRQSRLAGRFGGGGGDPDPAGGADHALSAQRGAGGGGTMSLNRRAAALYTALSLGYAFLYLPILLLVIY